MRFLVFPRDRLCNFSELPIHPRKFANGVQLLLLILRLLTAPECGVKGSVKPEEFLQIRRRGQCGPLGARLGLERKGRPDFLPRRRRVP